jgi:hypothetical protein
MWRVVKVDGGSRVEKVELSKTNETKIRQYVSHNLSLIHYCIFLAFGHIRKVVTFTKSNQNKANNHSYVHTYLLSIGCICVYAYSQNFYIDMLGSNGFSLGERRASS